jgi:hypothetical protein
MKRLNLIAAFVGLIALGGCAKGPEETPPPPQSDPSASAQVQSDQTAGGDFVNPASAGSSQLQDTSNQGLEEVAAGQAGVR